MNPGPALVRTELPLELFSRGKVRDTYVLDSDRLLMVATDRISAYDHVLPTGIPDKGKVLTQLSVWWFSQTHDFQRNHLISGILSDLPAELRERPEELAGRMMIVRRASRIDIECVVRGHLAGSGWTEYRESGSVAGVRLPEGLVESQRLPEPIFSPARKAASGHDENITFEAMADEIGGELAERLRADSLALFAHAAEAVAARGLILADTKFEFGRVGDEVILIDEVLTPDSSRYWDAALHRPGATPASFDKQFVRDWLTGSGWDRESDPPALPDDVVAQTRDKYLQAYLMVTAQPLFTKERV
ncbi:MAG: phosphoribosylaminoimidazolesuccinocarboxamide synthase [Candidatus Dormibacteraceae bacterium]